MCLECGAVPAVTQVMFKKHSWAGNAPEVENPEKSI
jgi:hypothetical protein